MDSGCFWAVGESGASAVTMAELSCRKHCGCLLGGAAAGRAGVPPPPWFCGLGEKTPTLFTGLSNCQCYAPPPFLVLCSLTSVASATSVIAV